MLEADDTDTTAASATPPPAQVGSPRASRRRLFTGFGRAALAGALAAAISRNADDSEPEHPDAELLSALARFGEIEHTIWPTEGAGCRTIEEEDARARLMAPLRAEQAALVNRACALRATTLDGLRARARVLLLWDTELPTADAPESCIDDRMLAALIRDLLGGAVT